MTDKSDVCFSCGGLIRPQLYLNDAERMELDRLLELRDWRQWAKKVLEHTEPNKMTARELLHLTISGKIDPEEFARQYKELEKDLQLRGKKE